MNNNSQPLPIPPLTRKQKRKARKKQKRTKQRKEAAIKRRQQQETLANDPEHQIRIQLAEQQEAEANQHEINKWEEAERIWLQNFNQRKAQQDEEEKKLLEHSLKDKNQQAEDVDSGEGVEWDYVEEGPAEIIWKGNEIIVKKKRVKVAKQISERPLDNKDADRPTSNPLPPQSAAFASRKSGQQFGTAQEALDSVAQQVPNFGTEQDKAHCPFHLKTGACRFGTRCSRTHFYPDKSNTLLIKNMYNGPGLAWDQDEGLEYTDEEVERCYEEFYEDVHTEFMKFGELVNFKVCKNGSYHLRGNVYVHYKSLDSAILAYNTMNGRYFAGKQITCEFVGITRWKVAICGEYMKSRLKTCTHGTACNFIHCFRNPGGDYEWADWDNPPPRYWIKRMAALFGASIETELEYRESPRDSSRKKTPTPHRYHSVRFTHDKMEAHDRGYRREDSGRKKNEYSTCSDRREYSSRRKERSLVDKHKQSEENYKSKDSGYSTKYCHRDHDTGGDNSKGKDRENRVKRRDSELKNSSKAHERPSKKHKKEDDDLSRWQNGEDISDGQEKSKRKQKSKFQRRHAEEHVSSSQHSGHTDDNSELTDGCSSKESNPRHSIDAEDRYSGRFCSDGSSSGRDHSHQNSRRHSKHSKEKRESDQCNPRYHTRETIYDEKRGGKEGKLSKLEASCPRVYSDESSDGWETTYRDFDREESCEHFSHDKSCRSSKKYSKSIEKGKHHRGSREHEVNNSFFDEELDRKAYKKHSRSQTPTPLSASLKGERKQHSSRS